MTGLWTSIVSKVVGAKAYLIAIGAAVLAGLALLAKFAADNRAHGRLQERNEANERARKAVEIHERIEQDVDRMSDSAVRQRLRDKWGKRD